MDHQGRFNCRCHFGIASCELASKILSLGTDPVPDAQFLHVTEVRNKIMHFARDKLLCDAPKVVCVHRIRDNGGQQVNKQIAPVMGHHPLGLVIRHPLHSRVRVRLVIGRADKLTYHSTRALSDLSTFTGLLERKLSKTKMADRFFFCGVRLIVSNQLGGSKPHLALVKPTWLRVCIAKHELMCTSQEDSMHHSLRIHAVTLAASF